jgi:molecular chaperone DnaJ
VKSTSKSTLTNRGCRQSSSTATTSDSSKPKTSNKAADHKNESFLKSAWHRLTGEHDNLEPEKPEEKTSNEKEKEKEKEKDDDEQKKASGSG